VQNKLKKEILAIIIISFSIALVYNSISDKGIALIRKPVELNWESDASIDNLVNKDTAKLAVKPEEMKQAGAFSSDNINSKKDKDVKPVAGVETPKQQPKDTLKSSEKKEPEKISNPEPAKIVTPSAITVDQAYKLYNNGAIFLDPRMEVEYKLGHIKGAIHLPYKWFDQHVHKISHLSKDDVFICYCDGAGCDLSIDLAKKLVEMGYKNVKIFYSGWNDWKERNYPMELP